MIRQFRTLTLVCGLTAIACYLVAAEEPLLIGAVIPAGIASWVLRDTRLALHVPRFAMNVCVLLALAYTGALVLSRGLRVDDVATLVVVLLIIKFFDRTTSRDYGQVLGLSTFLVIGAVLTSVRFEMGLLLVPFLPLAASAAMLRQVYAGHEAAALAAKEGSPPGVWARPRLYAGENSRAHFRRLTLASCVASTAIGAAAFVLIPRGIGMDLIAPMSPVAAGSQTRFTPKVQLGRAGFISQSQRIVMYVQVYDSTGLSLGGPSAVYHLRGNILDQYDPGTGTWSRSPGKTAQDKGGQSWQAGDHVFIGKQVDTPTVEQRITLLNASGPATFVFALQRPVELAFDRRVEISWNAEDRRVQLMNQAGEIQYRVESVLVDMPDAPARFEPDPPELAVSPPPEEQAPLPERDPSGEWPLYANAAIADLAARVVEDAGVDASLINREHGATAAAARAIERHLRENYAYTTEIQSPPDEGRPDPVEWFLLEHRSGHCEYFASAMAVMCQSLGIPARVVAGYVAAEWNAAGAHYVVRESNAHAWVEVRQAPTIWRAFDPTPPADLERLHRPSSGFLARARRLMDTFEHAWISSIVTFDQGARQRLVDRAAPGSVDWLRLPATITARIRSGGSRLLLTAACVGFGVAGATWALLAGARAGWRRARSVAPPRRGGAGWRRARLNGPASEQGAFYLDLLDALAARGFIKPAWCPPRDFAGAVQAVQPTVGEAAARLSDLYYAVRFGGRPLTDAERGEIGPCLGAIRPTASGS